MILPILHSKKWKSLFYYSIALFILSFISFDTKAQDWEEEESSDGSLPIRRHECGYVEVNGKFYLLGGRKAGIEKYVSIYDPATKKWTQGATANIPLHHFQPVVYNNKIYVMGAFTGNFPSETPVDNIYIYDPAANTWTIGPAIPQARRRGSAGAVAYNNKIYLVGGIVDGHSSGFVKWFDEYNPATDTWTTLTDAPRERDHFQAAIVNNKLVLAGGRQTSTANGSSKVIKEVDIYTFSSQSWSTTTSVIPTARAGTAVVVSGDELFVIGGEGPNAPAGKAHSETEAFDITKDSWRSVATLNTGRHATGAIFYNGSIYIASGSNAAGGNFNSELLSQEVIDLGGGSGTTESLQVDADINFGQVVNKDSKEISLSIKNTSSSNVVISNIAISGTNSAEFSLVSVNLPLTVNAGQTATITVVFEPLTIGDKTADLTITHNGAEGTTTVDLVGESVLTITSNKNAINIPVKIYPNPFNENIFVDLTLVNGSSAIKIFSSMGTLNKEYKGASSIIEINGEDLQPGVYYMQILQTTGDASQTIKLIKK